MLQNTHQNLKRRLSVFTKKKDEPTKVSLLNTVYPKPVFPSGAANLAKNARKKPLKTQIQQMKWIL